jgi:hypothetical protein
VSFGSVAASACRDAAAPWAARAVRCGRRQPSGSGQHLLGITDCPGARLKSSYTTSWYQFCICDIVSMWRMSMHGVRMFTERDFCRGRHGQESEKGKDREGSHQEGGKEDLKEKEVAASTTEKLPPPGRNPDAKRNLSKES